MNVSQLRELLGHDVLLLAWPKGSKGTKRKWGHLTVESMTPKYLTSLERGNIGVALGRKSGNLVALDVDANDIVQPFLASNPFLKDTLQTHGARGRVFWLRMAGDYPAKTVKLKAHSGDDAGEWRAGTNAQSIIQGIHPNTGKPYQVDVMAKPLTVEFSKLVWPQEIMNPPSATEDTEETEDTEDTDESDDTNEVVEWLFSVRTTADALRISKPTAPHHNYRLALVLARAVKALEQQAGRKFTPKEHEDIHQKWLTSANGFLRPGQSHNDYFMEYLNAYKLAKFPLGSAVVAQALERAKKNPLPADTMVWAKDQDIRLLATLCRELQTIAGNGPFFLSARMVQRIFNHPTHATGAKWLRSFCVMEVLDEVKKGIGLKASRYRWILNSNPKGVTP